MTDLASYDVLPAAERTRFFAWYNLAGYLASAVGALTVGAWLGFAHERRWSDLAERVGGAHP